jgi:hypothetical protein
MRKFFMVVGIILPLFFMQAIASGQGNTKKIQKKEIAASKLPDKITKYISANLPNAKITKAVKQKRQPEATYVVHLTIKTKYHTLVFNKSGELVKLDGKKLDSTVLK